MENTKPEHFLWVEKYRPKTIEECILPKEMRSIFEGVIESGNVPNLLLHGSAGVGKTTVARALCNAVGVDSILINASNESGIDTIRTKIINYATSVSFSGNKKVIILDEADATTNQFQSAIRAITEDVSDNCTFIFTCNYPKKIIEPIHSRCNTVHFKINKDEMPTLAGKMFKRVINILEKESIDYDKKVVAELVQHFFPDFRKTLNELQKYAIGGSIDVGILSGIGNKNLEEVLTHVKNRKWSEMRKWVSNNTDQSATFFVDFYNFIETKVAPKSLPEIVLLVQTYIDKSANSVSQEITQIAFFTELMSLSSGIEFK